VLQWLRANREQASKLGGNLRAFGLAGVLAYGLLNTGVRHARSHCHAAALS
jgi:hypothetical protein